MNIVGNFLLIIGSPLDNRKNLHDVLDLLDYLKKEDIDVCFSTHYSYGLDKVSERCKYVCYDKNNLLLDQNDLINSIHVIDEDKINTTWVEWFKPNDDVVLETFIPWDPYQRSALSVIKNGVSVAGSNGYKWICYLECDVTIPNGSLKEFISEKISDMRAFDKKSFILRGGNGFNSISGRFMIFETSLLINNPLFKSDWYSSSTKWFLTYGNMSLGGILENFLSPGNSEYALIYDYKRFWEEIWGRPDEGINKFELIDYAINTEEERVMLMGSLKISFYVNERPEGLYDLEIWAFNTHEDWTYIVDDFTVNFKGISSELNPSFISPGSWYNIANSFSIDSSVDDVFSFSYSFRNNQGSGEYNAEQSIRSGDLRKLSMIKRKNIEKY